MFDFQQVKLLTGLPDAQVRLLAQTFLAELRDNGGRLQFCFARKDWEGIRKLAHTLKPSFYLMGVSEAMESIEYFLSLHLQDANQVVLENHILRFEQLCGHVENEIKATLRESVKPVPA